MSFNNNQYRHCRIRFWIGWLCCLMVWGLGAGTAFAAAPHEVLVLHSYHQGLSWTDSINRGIRSVFPDDAKVDLSFEYMDTKRVFDVAHLDNLYRIFHHKYKDKTFDAIISTDDHAFRFLLQHHHALFAHTPIVFCGVNAFDPELIRNHPEITGVVEAFDIEGTLKVAFDLQPHARYIVAIGDQTVTGKANRALFEKAVRPYADKVTVGIYDTLNMDQVQTMVADLSDETILVWLHFTADSQGRIFSFEESAEAIGRNSNAPMYSFWDFHLGHGIVGGMLTSGHAQGQSAAHQVLRILNGQPVASIPVIYESPNRYMFDYRQLERFQIPTSRLPKNATVLNRPKGVSPQMRVWIWSAAISFLIMITVVLVLYISMIRQRRVEKKMSASNARYRHIFESATVSIWEQDLSELKKFLNQLKNQGVTDFESYFEDHPEKVHQAVDLIRVIDVNATTLSMYKISDREAFLLSPQQVHVAETTPALIRQLSAMARGGRYFETESVHRALNGELLYIHLSMTFPGEEAFFDSVLVCIMDISDRKRSEVALQQSESRFRCAFDQAATGMALISTDGSLLRVNQALTRVLGLSAAELLLRQWKDMVHADDVLALDQQRHRLKNGGLPQPLEIQLKNSRGGYIWALFSASLVDEALKSDVHRYLICQFQDITKRKQAEEALQASEEIYRQFYENDLSGVYVSDINGHVEVCNQAFATIFGFPGIENAIGYDLKALYKNIQERERFIEQLAEKRKLRHYEIELTKLDGTRVHALVNAVGIFDESGRLIKIRGYMFDATRQHLLEEQLRQAQKMESIGTMAGGVAHDFNNLMMGIMGNISLMQLQCDSEHPNYSNLQAIEQLVESGAKLTRQLLGFAKGGKYEVRSTNINELIAKNSLLFGRTKKELRIHRQLTDDIWPVEVDRSQIDQVFYNLYVNAWQAMEGSGQIHIETANVHLDADDADVNEIDPGQYVCITIRDTGRGMDADTLPRIFDPFFTTKEKGRGTGLGLASAYGIIKNHGGMITAESQPGVGTTFWVYLPYCDKQVKADPAPIKGLEIGKGVVLLVDDEDMVVEVGAEMLRRLGYTTFMVRSGTEAIHFFEKKGSRVDLVVLDMVMPDMDGGKVFDRIREINPDARVLLSSGYALQGRAAEIMDRGCNGFIQKPFNLSALSRKVKEVLTDGPAANAPLEEGLSRSA